MKLRKSRRAVSIVMDELEARVNRGMRRPMNMILETISQIRRMKFAPEDDASMAQALRDGMRERGLMGLYSDEQVAVLKRGLDEMREGFAKKAIR